MTLKDNSSLFSEDSERATLSILLQHPKKFYEGFFIKPEMCSSLPNTILLEAIYKLHANGLVPEPMLLTEYLRQLNKLEDAGGEEYIQHLAKGEYNPDNFKSYEGMVLDSYRGRSLLNLVNKVPGLIKSGSNISKVLTYIKDKISELLMNSGGNRTESLINILKTSWEKIIKRRANPGVQGQSTGFPSIDLIINGGSPGDLIIVAGRPSQGKSVFVACSALFANEPCIIFSFEMSSERLSDRFLSIESQIPSTQIRQGNLTTSEMELLAETRKRIEDKQIFIDTNYSADITYVTNTVRQYHQMYGIKSVYLDYVQLMSQRDEGSTHEIGRICRQLKILANELGIVVYVVSQLNRLVELRDNKRPILSDLRQSGNLEEDADIVMFLYRDAYYNTDTEFPDTVEILLRKNRDGEIGMIPLKFKGKTVTILDKGVRK